ncbi:hypothetical protein PAP_07825 [Palaeococcus pacificus DY20341]|uniref:Uncharacterized protein n=1 Tax=Palaeococcus pacificus DY20341 TaxID=1343739 RepID=A0A075LUA8_9EURY|nr:hypothetical protein [Palaeococcus pacificus]AIF69954.1 hypothetical protein PAP_07825 [Palaeococcus pacificus DY20341]
MDVFSLLQALRGPQPLTPHQRVKDFQRTLQTHKIGDEIEISGFLLLREPPHPPKDALYYFLSPLSPSELQSLKRDEFRSFAVLKITDKASIPPSLEFKSGEYVKVKGVVEAYPYGLLKAINVTSIEGRDYSEYWLEYKEYALSRRELESLFSQTIYADNNQIEMAFLYSLFSSPRVIGLSFGEGAIFSTLKDNEKVVKSFWEASKYLVRIFPRELRLQNPKSLKKPYVYVDENFDLDFVLFNPTTSLRYYSPETKRLLKKEIPVANWAERYLLEHDGVFLTPKQYSQIKANDPLAHHSETPFLPNKPLGLERNREFEQLIPNIIITIALARERFKTFSPNDEVVSEFRGMFDDWLVKNKREYGEKFDALRLKGMVFETNTRFHLSLFLLGQMVRFEGAFKRSIAREVLTINQELLDTWMNELSEEELIKALETYEGIVNVDNRTRKALSIFMDLEATSFDGYVNKGEFYDALIKYGFKHRYAEELIDKLLREGFLFEPSIGKLKLTVRDF